MLFIRAKTTGSLHTREWVNQQGEGRSLQRGKVVLRTDRFIPPWRPVTASETKTEEWSNKVSARCRENYGPNFVSLVEAGPNYHPARALYHGLTT